MKYCFLIITFLYQFSRLAQVSKIDSLSKKISDLEKHSTASLRDSFLVKTYHHLSLAYYHNSDLIKSQIEAKKKLSLSEKTCWDKGQIVSYQDISYSNFKLGKLKSCLQLNYKALTLAEKKWFNPRKTILLTDDCECV